VRTSPILKIGPVSVCVSVCLLIAVGQDPASVQQPQGSAQTPRLALGAGSCGSTDCHGSPSPRVEGRIKQNEYRTWLRQDSHAGAYTILLQPRSKKIGVNLGIDNPESTDLCLNCHALNIAPNLHAATFNLSEGVSCESCHGLAGEWLGPHTRGDLTREQFVTLGMYDTRDLVLRLKLCLSCHLGNEEKTVDHELIAAGHPDLVFELDNYAALMPRHWEEEDGNWQGVMRWAIGQALALGESMSQLAGRLRGPAWQDWPEFADFECFSCHHNVGTSEASRTDSRTGLPTWNPSRYIVFKHALRTVLPAEVGRIEEQVSAFEMALTDAATDRQAAADAAMMVASLIDRVVPQLEEHTWTEEEAIQTLKRISENATEIAHAGIRSAEQATMAVDAIYISLEKSTGRANPPLNSSINVLYDSVQSTSLYSAVEFASQLARLVEYFP